MQWDVPRERETDNHSRYADKGIAGSRFNHSFKEVYDIPQEVELLQSILVADERSAAISIHNRTVDVRWTRHLSKNSITDFSTTSFNKAAIDKADYVEVNFPCIPPALKSLPSLRYLNLSKNLIKFWPDFMAVRSFDQSQRPPFSLIKFNIRENFISDIPEAIAKGWGSLEELDISFNLLMNVNHIHHASNLRLLKLERNPITELPFTFSSLSKLECVSLDWSEAINPIYKFIITKTPSWARYAHESLSLTSLFEAIRRHNQERYPFEQFFSDFNQQQIKYRVEPRLLRPFLTSGRLFDAKLVLKDNRDLLGPEILMTNTKIGILDDLIEHDMPRQVNFLLNCLPDSALSKLFTKCRGFPRIQMYLESP